MDFRSLIAASVAACFVIAPPVFAEDVATDNLEISGGFSRASPKMAKAGVGFMTITSKGAADRLIAFTSPSCNRPELHTHIRDNGVMRMRQVEAIDVPAGGSVKLEPGSFHLMCIDLNGQLVEGEMLEATLSFETAGDVVVKLPIKGPGAMMAQ
ncbi:copper chaperone PCu(A)C [Aliiroseovarius crassostreae]|uniref:copper chaperone PCu(A)C n=1 Tax=Aliiroseovarius crassostreae TaxID=154981 RepID=UPI00220CF66B|nr:copper chaperone PCu(A)C [Aliiroseovarius crassostreae]UWQ07870.1 copper chaperone PCu(A)C [Aliiroseovarius crassostreae]